MKCQTVIDLKKPEKLIKSRGYYQVYRYRCPKCKNVLIVRFDWCAFKPRDMQGVEAICDREV